MEVHIPLTFILVISFSSQLKFFFDCIFPVESKKHITIISLPMNDAHSNYCKVSHADVTKAPPSGKSYDIYKVPWNL